MLEERDELPAPYEHKYHSEYLKEQIADGAMWSFIPSVDYLMDSPQGKKRLQQNDPLFTFIDMYMPEGSYEFEPNMKDGRFVMVPVSTLHQGIGLCVSERVPGYLDTGHFWYPSEYTRKHLFLDPGQVYISAFSSEPDQAFADYIKPIYIDRHPGSDPYCTFPFTPETTVELQGYFLDHLRQSVQTIRDAVSKEGFQVQKNAEGLILFMKRVMQ